MGAIRVSSNPLLAPICSFSTTSASNPRRRRPSCFPRNSLATNAAWPQAEVPPRRRQIAARNPRPTGDLEQPDRIRAHRAPTIARARSTVKTRQSPPSTISSPYEKCGLTGWEVGVSGRAVGLPGPALGGFAAFSVLRARLSHGGQTARMSASARFTFIAIATQRRRQALRTNPAHPIPALHRGEGAFDA